MTWFEAFTAAFVGGGYTIAVLLYGVRLGRRFQAADKICSEALLRFMRSDGDADGE